MDSDQVETRLSDLKFDVEKILASIDTQTEYNEATGKAIAEMTETIKWLVLKLVEDGVLELKDAP